MDLSCPGIFISVDHEAIRGLVLFSIAYEHATTKPLDVLDIFWAVNSKSVKMFILLSLFIVFLLFHHQASKDNIFYIFSLEEQRITIWTCLFRRIYTKTGAFNTVLIIHWQGLQIDGNVE